MSKIDDLIEKLCPNGVEYKPIWSLTAWDKKFNGVDKEKQKNVISYKYYLSTDFAKVEKKNGNIKYISTGISGDDRYTTEELAGDYLAEGEVVCIPWGGTPNVKYHKGKFVTGDNRIATSLDINILSNKFLYYWMQSKINVISKFYRGSGIKHPSMKDVLDMNIAVPPLEVQCEIVHILDDFTLLSALLSAELKARQQQYEYYKDKLFSSFIKNENIQWTTLGRYCKRLKGTAITAGKMKEIADDNGNIKIFAGGKTMINTDESNIPDKDIIKVPNIIVQSRGIIDFIYYDKPCSFKREMWSYTTENVITLKFIYYYLKNNIEFFRQRGKQMGSMPQISLDVTEKYKIPILPIEEQEMIVKILDKFEKLCNDISEGLPAEIEARQKQYEYYRDKLLTFKELKVNE